MSLQETLSCLLIAIVTVSADSRLSYFSSRWTSFFTPAEINSQPKWRLIDSQPRGRSYEVREYNAAFWISSSLPCWSYDDAVSKGYFNLYLFTQGFNEENIRYPLTYPVVTRVRTNNARHFSPIKSIMPFCNTQYSSMVFLPETAEDDVAMPIDDSIRPELLPQRLVYVKEYIGSPSSATCNLHRSQLTSFLSSNGVKFQHDEWYCVKYPGDANKRAKYEVWVSGEWKEKEEKVETTDGGFIYHI